MGTRVFAADFGCSWAFDAASSFNLGTSFSTWVEFRSVAPVPGFIVCNLCLINGGMSDPIVKAPHCRPLRFQPTPCTEMDVPNLPLLSGYRRGDEGSGSKALTSDGQMGGKVTNPGEIDESTKTLQEYTLQDSVQSKGYYGQETMWPTPDPCPSVRVSAIGPFNNSGVAGHLGIVGSSNVVSFSGHS